MNIDKEFNKWWANEPVSDFHGVDAGHVEAAFAAGRKAEREACAKTCENLSTQPPYGHLFSRAARAIRERSNA